MFQYPSTFLRVPCKLRVSSAFVGRLGRALVRPVFFPPKRRLRYATRHYITAQFNNEMSASGCVNFQHDEPVSVRFALHASYWKHYGWTLLGQERREHYPHRDRGSTVRQRRGWGELAAQCHKRDYECQERQDNDGRNVTIANRGKRRTMY